MRSVKLEILEYLYAKMTRTENELCTLYNNLAQRKLDDLDLLDLIIMRSRGEMLSEITTEMIQLLQLRKMIILRN